MPFTPFHMGPGVLVKALMRGSFSLMVFGYAQIVMDIQPLIVLLTGEGHLHGFSHTYVGASLLAVFAAITGKYLSELGLIMLGLSGTPRVRIAWVVAIISAFIGTFSHVLLDRIMHSDVEPFIPVSHLNPFLGLISVSALHKLCLYMGMIGAALYFTGSWYFKKRNDRQPL